MPGLRANAEGHPAMVDLLLHRDKGRVRMQWLLHGGPLHRPGALLHRLRNGLRPVDMHATMRGILHPAFHREQPHGIRSQHDVVDPVQPRRLRSHRQRRGRVVPLRRVSEQMTRQCADSVQRLHIQPMLRMCCLGQQRRMPGVFERGKRVLADDSVGVEVVSLLEGTDGVVGSWA